MARRFFSQIPNLLSFTRVLLCPLSVSFLFQGKFKTAILIFSMAAVTDFLDGFLARRFQWTSPLGKLLDPVCDKIVTVCLFAALMSLGSCPFWFLGLLISVHLLQCIGYVILNLPTTSLRVAFQPLAVGKWNTAVQLVWIVLHMLNLSLKARGLVLFGAWGPSIFTLGYALLGISQIAVFLSYFFHFRVYFTPELRLTR